MGASSSADTAGSTATGSSDTTASTSTGDTAEPFCGNHQIEGTEQCDDGNADYTDACSNDCIASCGVMWSHVLGQGRGIDVAVTPGRAHVLTGTPDKLGESLTVAVLDPEGQEIWTRGVPSTGLSGRALAVSPRSHNIAVALGDETVEGEIQLLDGRGTALWSQSGAFEPCGIAIDGADNVWASGRMQSNADTSSPWIVKYDGTGTPLWVAATEGVEGLPDGNNGTGRIALSNAGDGYVMLTIGERVPGEADTIALGRIAGSDGQWTWIAPVVLDGNGPYRPVDLGVTTDGRIISVISRADSGTNEWTFWLLTHDQDGQLLNLASADDLGAAPQQIAIGIGIDAMDRVGLVGAHRPDDRDEAFSLRLDARGAVTCTRPFSPEGTSVTPSSVDVDAGGNMFVTGTQVTAGRHSIWTARFRF